MICRISHLPFCLMSVGRESLVAMLTDFAPGFADDVQELANIRLLEGRRGAYLAAMQVAVTIA
jgi:hypothetical protein